MKLLIILILLTGCKPPSLVSKYKCNNGILYIKFNGAWVEARLYEKNKCLPLEETP